MGDVVKLGGLRSLQPSPSPAAEGVTATFFFDLASPFTYLLAERIERRFSEARWKPVADARSDVQDRAFVAEAERRAQQLRMPLVWPERFPAPVPNAMRAATYAAEQGRGAGFVIALGRLAFCGGYDVEDARILAEAAAAAGVDVEAALGAAADPRRDRVIEAATRGFEAAGGRELPALLYGDRLHCGELTITGATLRGTSGGASARPRAS